MATLQPELLDDTGKAVVRFNIRDPRAPAKYNPQSRDSRPLGLFIQSLTIEPILTLTSGRLIPIAPDTACDVLISFRTQIDTTEYLVLRLNADAAGSVKVSLNNTHFDFAEIPVSLGEQIRVVKDGGSGERRGRVHNACDPFGAVGGHPHSGSRCIHGADARDHAIVAGQARRSRGNQRSSPTSPGTANRQ